MKYKFDLKTIFYLDLRALGVLRILFATILLFDLKSRSRDLVMHYTDSGVLPIYLLIEQEWKAGFFSIHAFSGSWEWQIFLLTLQGIFAITLLLGYKSKLSVFICWILLISLHNRNPLVLNSGDVYFRLLLFWCLFLPIGARYSIDSIKSLNFPQNKFFNIGTIGLIVQVMLIYLMGVIFKNSSEWLYNGTALYYALSLDQMVKPFGSWLLNFPETLKFLTFSTLAVELIAPLLFISPIRNSFCRIIGIFLLISLHVGIELTLHIGIFAFVCIAALVGLLPTTFVDKVNKTTSYVFKRKIKKNQSEFVNTEVLKSRVINCIGAVFIIYIITWNLNTIPVTPELIPNKGKIPANILRLDQKWSMFAPVVMKSDGWYIFEAMLNDGRRVDLFHQHEIMDTDYSQNKPSYLFLHYKNARWRKYLSNLFNNPTDQHFEEICNAFINSWQKTNREKITELNVFFMHEPSLPIGYPFISNKHHLYKKSPD